MNHGQRGFVDLAGAFPSNREAEDDFRKICTRQSNVFSERGAHVVRRGNASKRNMLKKIVRCPSLPATGGTNDDSRLLTTRAKRSRCILNQFYINTSAKSLNQ